MATAKKAVSANKAAPAKKAPAKKAPAKTAPAAAPAPKTVPVGAPKTPTKGAAPAKKRAPNAAFMKAMKPSPALAAVIGDKPVPRTEVTKKVWEYIRKHGLQDSTKRTMINADAKLKEIFKADQVSMFEMTKLISEHLKPTE
jgi:chromatin remodeling complex protein RSC6